MPLDGQGAVQGRAHAGPALAGFAITFCIGVVILLLAARFGAPAWSDGGYWAIGIAAAAAVALAAGAPRLMAASSSFGGMSLAAGVLTAAYFLAIPGVIFAAGHDGLAYALGLGAGGLLLQLVIAPRFARSGADSLPGLFAARFPGRAVALVSLAVITASMVLLLVAELTAAGFVGMRLLGVGFPMATIAAACAVLACFVLRGAWGSATANGLLYLLMLTALLVPLAVVSAQWYGLPIPQIAYANSLWQLQGIEENLLEQELADPAYMRPLLTAFLTLTPTSFIGIVVGLAVGVAALPSLLLAPLAAVPARSARHTALWGLGLLVLLLTLAPAAATYVRHAIATLIADKTPVAELPGWVFAYGKLGLVHICERAATDISAVVEACAALPEAATALRLQDIVIDPDVVALALPEIVGLDSIFMGLFAVAVIASALATAHAPLSVIVRALGLGSGAPAIEPTRGIRLGSYVIAAAIVAASATLALLRVAGIIDVATWAVVLAAAGLFPALAAALWWRRANAWGAAAGMLAGFGFVLVYGLGREFFAVPFYAATSALSSGGEAGLQYFDELKDAWLAAEPGAAKDAAWVALNAHAQTVADWWGVSGPATVLLALPLGFLVLVVVSLLTPAARGLETAP